jgi:hypothetical protein
MTEFRTIKNVRLYEVSLVTWPGHPEWTFKILDGTDGREVHAATEVE